MNSSGTIVQKKLLGRTGLAVSEVGLGTWAFASQVYGAVSERLALETVRTALELGINFFDTAPLYGTPDRDGTAEKLLGKALRGRRDETVIASKFGRMSTNPMPAFDSLHAKASVEASLKRLQTDRIDVLYFHSPFSPAEINDDVWEMLATLRQEGKLRYIGHSVSMFSATAEMCKSWALEFKIDVVQVVYSLLNRETEELIQALDNLRVGIVARESLANGFLTGKITQDTEFSRDNLNSRYTREEIAERVVYVENLEETLIREEDQGLPGAALRFVLDNPAISCVLSGAKDPQEIREAAAVSSTHGFRPETHGLLRRLHTKDFPAA